MNTDAINLLKRDNEKMLQLLDKLIQTQAQDSLNRNRLLDILRQELRIHAQLEEELIFPLLRQKGENELWWRFKDSIFLVDHFALPDLEALGLNINNFNTRVKALKRLLVNHASNEGNVLFEKVKDLLGQEELNELGEKIMARKKSLTSFDYC